MALRDRVYRITDAPMTWTKAILLGFVLWIILIIATGQIPSYVIYWFDKEVAAIIDFSKKIPGVNDEGLNPKQIAIVRDLVANGIQMTAFAVILIFMYFWQEKKRKRLGAKGLQDPVRGYMSGK
jgi:hypothetical protein